MLNFERLFFHLAGKHNLHFSSKNALSARLVREIGKVAASTDLFGFRVRISLLEVKGAQRKCAR